MADNHSHDDAPENNGIQVDARILVDRLRQQRSELQNQLDIVGIAYEDAMQQNRHLLERIAELEATEKQPSKSKG